MTTPMQRYKNQQGDSGVTAYALEPEAIRVRFADGATYLYTWQSAGRDKVEQMKRLARDGRGLCSYISREVRDAYAAKL
ncbi:MAG: hypothetical protein ABIT83_06100 [Massilia sp.]